MKDQAKPAIVPGMDIFDVPYEYIDRGFRYYVGSKGVGGYTQRPDDQGWYHFFYCKPSGRGARSDPTEYKYVPRTVGKRRKRKHAEQRAFELSTGTKTERVVKPKVEHPPGTGYCMSCKEHRLMLDPQTTKAKNGRVVIRGHCVCGTTMQKFGKFIDCPECGENREAASDDYICKTCREEVNAV